MVDPILLSCLPQALEAERFVLGSILLDDVIFGEVAGALSPEDFALDKHQKIRAESASTGLPPTMSFPSTAK
jgi:DnaB-like helicase N terminal domain